MFLYGLLLASANLYLLTMNDEMKILEQDCDYILFFSFCGKIYVITSK